MSNQNNNKVRFLHYREPQFNLDDDDDSIGVWSRGGATVAYMQGEAGTTYAIAYCHERDNYSKKLGRIKSQGRLLSNRAVITDKQDRGDFIAAMDDFMMAYGLTRKSKKAPHVQE